MSELTPPRVPGCPACGVAVFAAGELEALRVKPDDVSVCLHCGALLMFNADQSLRQATEADMRGLRIDAESWELIHWLKDLVALRKRQFKGAAMWHSPAPQRR